MGAEARVLVFTRAPVPGRCKTRLIPSYGALGAARIHRRLTRRALEVAAQAGLATELWCAPGTGHGFLHACRRDYALTLRRQPHGDLGRRMTLALGDALRRGARGALLIGTDCADLQPADLHAALTALREHEVVLQPAHDGGFVLIGARVGLGDALRAIDWSSGRELRQTIESCRRRGLRCALLAPRLDVDRPADVRRARALGAL